MSANSEDNNSAWYVIHTHPRQEERCEANLNAWQVETFNPKIRERHCNPFTGKATFIVKPLFPRYLFARFCLGDAIQRIRFTRGVHSVVSFGNNPTAVADEIIAVIKSRIGDDTFVRLGNDLRPGDHLLIEEGAWKGFIGVFEREMKERDRIMVLLTTVSYHAHIVLERENVKRLHQAAAGK